MRLDKFLCEMNLGTRSEMKDLVRQGAVTVNGLPVRTPDSKINEETDRVCVRGKTLCYRKFYYYMLNKPAGLISAARDRASATVMELLRPEHRRPDLFPAGRLDRDTEGFLLLTNDGELAHRLLSPARHVDKVYRVSAEHSFSREDLRRLEEGVDIGEDRPTLPAKALQQEERVILLTIREGKFHQVKRMVEAVNNKVTALKRISFGGLPLDETLRPGEYRELTEEEVKKLYGA